MKQSILFAKTRKEVPADSDSINASYLVRAGFVEKYMAGVYSLLPLGLIVERKIENVIREEMNKLGGQEILMNVLQPKEIWDETGRWEEMDDIFYKMKDARGKEIGLGPTHEEQLTDILRKKIKSYKDLPVYLYQIQTKFRNEPRAKSGLLRTREFIMKDLYSFSENEAELMKFYEKAKETYLTIFKRLGIPVKVVEASGGVFSKYSHEFQTLAPQGEDEVYYCDSCEFAQNKEVAKVKEGDKCPDCGGKIIKENAIEVGNIFPLKTKYSASMGLKYLDKEGKEKEVYMGSYGIGPTRCLATIVEKRFDQTKNRMIWPEEISPYQVHLLSLRKNEEAEKVYNKLVEKGIEVLYDDRDISAGEKFAEADLIGCPTRIIISDKSLSNGGVEFVNLKDGKSEIVNHDDVFEKLNE